MIARESIHRPQTRYRPEKLCANHDHIVVISLIIPMPASPVENANGRCLGRNRSERIQQLKPFNGHFVDIPASGIGSPPRRGHGLATKWTGAPIDRIVVVNQSIAGSLICLELRKAGSPHTLRWDEKREPQREREREREGEIFLPARR